MKIIGLDKPLQYVVQRLKDKVELGFIDDGESKEVILCPEMDFCSKHISSFKRKGGKCKVLLILDCKERLNLIKGIQILDEIPEGDAFISYVKNKCTYAEPVFHKIEDKILDEMEEKTRVDSFFTGIIYPLIQKGIVTRSLKKEIPQAISASILNIVRKKEPPIVKYREHIRVKYYNKFIKWLETEEAKKVCECLLSSKLKYNFNPFEINYLLNNIKEE